MEGYNKTIQSDISKNKTSDKSSNALRYDTEKQNFIYRRQLLLATNTKKDKNYIKRVQQEISKANDAVTGTHCIFNSNTNYNRKNSAMEDFPHLQSNNKIPQLVTGKSYASANKNIISPNIILETKPVVKIEPVDPSYHPFESVFVKQEENKDIPTHMNQPNNKEVIIKQEREDAQIIIKQEKEDCEVTVKQEKEDNYQEELPFDIKEEFSAVFEEIPTSKCSTVKSRPKPLLTTLKNKEFTGYNLFAVNQRNVIRANKPKAHFMEIQHTIRKDWFRLTTKARLDYEAKAIRISQERECLKMLKRIKDAYEIDEQKRLAEVAKNPPQEEPLKKKKKTTNISSNNKTLSAEEDSLLKITPQLSESQICLRPRLKKCSVLLSDCMSDKID